MMKWWHFISEKVKGQLYYVIVLFYKNTFLTIIQHQKSGIGEEIDRNILGTYHETVLSV